MQTTFDGIKNLPALIKELGSKKFMLVCGSSFNYSGLKEDVESLSIPFITFSDFTPNPLRSDAKKGLELFKKEGCDLIIAVGGGSPMDVAKCIKHDGELEVPIIAIPTTAGTGSESTKHIVVYEDGKKQSISSEKVIPEYAIFEPKVLKTLPDYQKKCTLLDALCQAIESRWCNSATADSIAYAETAIRLIMQNKDAYINDNDEKASINIMKASNFSGKAINITATTAPHAMSYKLSALYKIPHGYAVAIGLPEVWEEMCLENNENLNNRFLSIANALGASTIEDGIEVFRNILKDFCMNKLPEVQGEIDIKELVSSVNPTRLKNNPVQFDEERIEKIYKKILG